MFDFLTGNVNLDLSPGEMSKFIAKMDDVEELFNQLVGMYLHKRVGFYREGSVDLGTVTSIRVEYDQFTTVADFWQIIFIFTIEPENPMCKPFKMMYHSVLGSGNCEEYFLKSLAVV